MKAIVLTMACSILLSIATPLVPEALQSKETKRSRMRQNNRLAKEKDTGERY